MLVRVHSVLLTVYTSFFAAHENKVLSLDVVCIVFVSVLDDRSGSESRTGRLNFDEIERD